MITPNARQISKITKTNTEKIKRRPINLLILGWFGLGDIIVNIALNKLKMTNKSAVTITILMISSI